MTIDAAAALAFATLLFALVPGPGVVAVVAQTLGRGFGHGVRFAAGLLLGDMLFLLAALYGMGWAAAQLGEYFFMLKWLGAGYLVWIGIRTILDTDAAPQGVARHRWRSSPFWAGLFITLGNPKVVAFYCGFLPGFVDMASLSASDAVQVVTVMAPIVFLVPVCYAWGASRGRHAGLSRGWGRVLRPVAGSVLCGSGVAVVVAD